MSRSVLLFRSDLRVNDNDALRLACQSEELIPVFIWDSTSYGTWEPSGASAWWLSGALERLKEHLKSVGSSLLILKGPVPDQLKQLHQQWNFDKIFLSETINPSDTEFVRLVEDFSQTHSVSFVLGAPDLLVAPAEMKTGSGGPYKVFTPFWNALQKRGFQYTLGEINCLPPLPNSFREISSRLGNNSSCVDRSHGAKWQSSLRNHWEDRQNPGLLLKEFERSKLKTYKDDRDFPHLAGTSNLSAFLRYGEISPRRVWMSLIENDTSEPFLRQLAWREFAGYTLFNNPQVATQCLRPEYESFPWSEDPSNPAYTAWAKGETGVQLVDAGMRELWQTGYMHNRVRMITASFLVKHLRVSWRLGFKWFWETLVDADLANNSMGWQWVAGCGVDASPFFRIFNPDTQAKRYDPSNTYINHWNRSPTFPPIVDLNQERARCLEIYKEFRNDS